MAQRLANRVGGPPVVSGILLRTLFQKQSRAYQGIQSIVGRGRRDTANQARKEWVKRLLRPVKRRTTIRHKLGHTTKSSTRRLTIFLKIRQPGLNDACGVGRVGDAASIDSRRVLLRLLAWAGDDFEDRAKRIDQQISAQRRFPTRQDAASTNVVITLRVMKSSTSRANATNESA
jgi:hypothetical protein